VPPQGYLTAQGIDQAITHLVNVYSSICMPITLPEPSVEGETIRAVKIAGGTAANRHGVLFLGGVHARELINPDALVYFAVELCNAYKKSRGLTFGGRAYTSFAVKLIVELLDVFVFPLVNPDGREYVQTVDAGWRKNRSPNPGQACKGTDLNRNYDFLWQWTIGNTSSAACTPVFKGNGAFSEPETRNVRWLLDQNPNIECLVDCHSYTEQLVYPWGDDDSQTTDATQNFRNPAYDGQRGVTSTGYAEYIPQTDLDWHVDAGTKMREAIAAVRGRTYLLRPSVQIYPVSGAGSDYSYSRHFVDTTKRRIYSYTLESAREFQPDYPTEGVRVIEEVASGLVQFCLSCLCPFRLVLQRHPWDELEGLFEILRAVLFLPTAAGRRYLRLLDVHALEATELLVADERLREQADNVLQHIGEVVSTWEQKEPRRFESGLVDAVDGLFRAFAERGSAELREAIDELRRDLDHFRGRTLAEGLEAVSKMGEAPAK
jgi:murein tripeptide amidase MpaA